MSENERVYHDIRTMLAGGLDELSDPRKGLPTVDRKLCDISQYYFDGKGKAIRPRLALAVADAVNHTLFVGGQEGGGLDEKEMTQLLKNQRQISIIGEMYHTASLYHDDVIDRSELRRAKDSVNVKWGQKSSVISGDFIMGIANTELGRTRDVEATIAMSRILFDLVVGEFQQMAKAKDDRRDRFETYIDKTYNKTASLLANAAKAVALLAENSSSIKNGSRVGGRISDEAFNYGRNTGIAFQLIDDWLDFSASAEMLGKPAAADMKLGLATAPVLFAAESYPELDPMIKRRFCESGDVERAFELVLNSNGLDRTKGLANEYGQAALDNIKTWTESTAKEELKELVNLFINRMV